jgi:hypothetical protein
LNALHTLAVERAGLPRVTIAQRVIDKMVKNALIYETETGEALIGLPVPVTGRLEPDLVVLETITPDNTAVRKYAYFEQGDDLQGDIMNWLHYNWNDYRQMPGTNIKPNYNVALDHLGDWHKHPGALTEPSWGDLETALAHVMDKEAGKPYLLAILATVWDRTLAHATDEAEAIYFGEQPIKVDIDANTTVRLDCWYMSRRTKRFVHLTPTVAANADLPALPIVSWHLNNTERFQQEFKAITGAGYTVSVDEYDTDGIPPRELCLTLAKRGAPNIEIVITNADFPNTRPNVWTVPMSQLKDIPEGADVFVELWKRAKAVPESDYPAHWDTNSSILELVRVVEQNLKG